MASKSTTKKTTKASGLTKAKATSSTKQSAVKSKPVTKAVAAPLTKPAIKAASTSPKASAPVAKPVAPVVKAGLLDDKHKITFTYFAPQAGSVFVAGDFTKWEASPISLVKEETGLWKTTVALKPGKYEYRLLVDGQWQNDPECAELHPNEFGSANCVLSVAA